VARENFYILLKLDPLENDETVILAAIEKNLNIWKGNLSKGISRAKWEGYLALEPEIRRVMLDPSLRRAEAKAAKEAESNKGYEKWAAEFAKDPMEIGLNEQDILSVYDFLSKDSDGNDSAQYGPHDSAASLKARASKLYEDYRQKNKAAEQNLIGKCAAFIEKMANPGEKKNYDRYIEKKCGKKIEDNIQSVQYSKVITDAAFQIIVKKYSRDWFSAERVREAAENYCRQKGYTIKGKEQSDRGQQHETDSQSGRSDDWNQAHNEYQHQYSNTEPNEDDIVYVKKPGFTDRLLTLVDGYSSYVIKMNAMTQFAFGDASPELTFSKKTHHRLGILCAASFIGFFISSVFNSSIGIILVLMFLALTLILFSRLWKTMSAIGDQVTELAKFYNRHDIYEVLMFKKAESFVDMFMSIDQKPRAVEKAMNMMIDEHNSRVDAYGGSR